MKPNFNLRHSLTQQKVADAELLEVQKIEYEDEQERLAKIREEKARLKAEEAARKKVCY